MTYQNRLKNICGYKIAANKLFYCRKSQQGVTLLLALLVLASVLAVSFSIAGILAIEIRTSGDLLKTEPALYAAGAVTEEALFKVKRKYTPAGSYYTTALGNINLTSPSAPVESSAADPVQQIRVLPSSNSFSNTQFVYPIYNPANPNGINSGVPAGGYGKIKITILDTGDIDYLKIYLCEISMSAANVDCSDVNSPNMIANGQGVNMMSRYIYNPKEYLLDPNKQYELRLVHGSYNTNRSIFLTLESFASSGASLVPAGLPFFSSTAVDVNASQAGIGRQIRVIIPQ